MIKIRFDNLDEMRAAYDPQAVDRAAASAIRRLHSKAATKVSKAIRDTYAIKAGEVSKALKKRVLFRSGRPEGFLIYTGKRLSLRQFTGYSGAGEPPQRVRPKVSTRAGVRRGVRARVAKNRPSIIIPAAFWGRGRAGREDGAGAWQIFQRIDQSDPDSRIRKLTGPSIAHMARGNAPLDEINQMMRDEGNDVLANELDNQLRRRAGLR